MRWPWQTKRVEWQDLATDVADCIWKTNQQVKDHLAKHQKEDEEFDLEEAGWTYTQDGYTSPIKNMRYTYQMITLWSPPKKYRLKSATFTREEALALERKMK